MKRLRLLLVGGALALAGCPRLEVTPEATPTPAPAPTPEPKPTPTPAPYVPARRTEFGKVFNGMQYKVTLETERGGVASQERKNTDSYAVEVTFKARVPKPNTEMTEIASLNPRLPELLPALPQLVERANVSPFYEDLYRLKVNFLTSRLHRLDVMLSRNNFYDCETILELQHPETKRRALLVQADMDVDEDGSDPERVAYVDGSSLTYQPFTSYKWPRKTKAVNPFLASREQALEKAKRDLAAPSVSAENARALKAQMEEIKAEIHSLKNYSFLVGAVDPFIVLPFCVVAKKTPFSPVTGDYCVVVHGNTLFPAIVGDVGPTYKMGEASLRICKEINARAGSYNAATSDLKITYLVFPGTADRPFAAPNLEKWKERCASLLEELGGTTGEMFAWKDTTLAAATPTPSPAAPAPGSPAPGSTPAPTAAPSPSASPMPGNGAGTGTPSPKASPTPASRQ